MGIFDFVKDVATNIAIETVAEITEDSKAKHNAKNITLSPRGALYLALFHFSNTEEKKKKVLSLIGEENIQSIDFKHAIEVLDYLISLNNPMEFVQKVKEETQWKEDFRINIFLNILDLITFDNLSSDYELMHTYAKALDVDEDTVQSLLTLFLLKNQSELDENILIYTQLLAFYNNHKNEKFFNSYFDFLYGEGSDFEDIANIFLQTIKEAEDKYFPLATMIHPIIQDKKTDNEQYAIITNLIDTGFLGGSFDNSTKQMLNELVENFSVTKDMLEEKRLFDEETIEWISDIMEIKNTHDFQ